MSKFLIIRQVHISILKWLKKVNGDPLLALPGVIGIRERETRYIVKQMLRFKMIEGDDGYLRITEHGHDILNKYSDVPY